MPHFCGLGDTRATVTYAAIPPRRLAELHTCRSLNHPWYIESLHAAVDDSGSLTVTVTYETLAVTPL